MMKSRVLLVEDEKDIQDLVALHLKREGFEVELASSGLSAWQALQSHRFQIAILDWMLPGDMPGIELARLIRSHAIHGSIAILMMTARAAPADVIAGLQAGADDYVTKPFDISVLMARVHALDRRQRVFLSSVEPGREVSSSLSVQDLTLAPDSHEVHAGRERIELTPYEFKLLHALMKNAGRVMARERLIEEVQGVGVSVVDRAIDTHVFGLRKKLGKAGDFIETVRGVGYRIAPPPKGRTS